jgi:hypothetical protein
VGGGQPSAVQKGNNLPQELPPGEKANLEYARKTTDLVLDYLRDQKDNPDPDLLEKLQMTPEELQRFYDRYEQMRRASETDGGRAQHEFDEVLRSLGLRPDSTAVRRGGTTNDSVGGQTQQGSRSRPPQEFEELFRAFKIGAGRAESDAQP